LCAISALGSGAYLGIHQLLNALYVLRLGFGPQSVGTLSAIGALSFSCASLLGGILGARIGTRSMMLLGVAINLVGMALLPLTQWAPIHWWFAWLVLAQIVSSTGWSMQVVGVIATMAAATEPATRRGAYALREAGAGLGMFTGALLGGILPQWIAGYLGVSTESPVPFQYALWGSVLLGAMTLLPLRLIRPAPALSRAATGHVPFRMTRSFLLLLACGFATNAAHAACKTFAAVYMDTTFQLPTSVIGAVTSAGLLIAIVAALGSARMGRRRSSGQMMIIGAAGILASLLVMALIRHPVGAMAGIVGVYGILGIWRPAYQALQMDVARPEWRSLISGASAMGMSLGFGSMSLGGGYIVTAAGYTSVFGAGAAAALVSALLAALLTWANARSAREPDGEQATEQAAAVS
jgi:predicted MFS family arabinose efflux permease